MATTQRQKTTIGGSVTGLSNAPIPGSIARAVCWFVGRRRARIISLFFIWPALNSSSPRYRFLHKIFIVSLGAQGIAARQIGCPILQLYATIRNKAYMILFRYGSGWGTRLC
jgi:hypothetical protein